MRLVHKKHHVPGLDKRVQFLSLPDPKLFVLVTVCSRTSQGHLGEREWPKFSFNHRILISDVSMYRCDGDFWEGFSSGLHRLDVYLMNGPFRLSQSIVFVQSSEAIVLRSSGVYFGFHTRLADLVMSSPPSSFLTSLRRVWDENRVFAW